MPAFDTPEPILATVEVAVGDLRITARDRTDTVVEIRPSDPSHEPDVRAAEQTRVELTVDGLLVRGPKQRGASLFSKPGSVDVTIDLPAGSRLRTDTGVATVRGTGPLAACRVKTGVGDIDLESAGAADVQTGSGAVTIGRVHGRAEVTTSSGSVRLAEVDGPAVVKNSNGETWIGAVMGDLQVTASNGSVSVDQADGDVHGKTANGSLRVGRVTRGVTSLRTSMGEIEVGIADGTAALVDAQTKFGRVRNGLTAADSPAPADETAEVHASTSFGDVVIRRA